MADRPPEQASQQDEGLSRATGRARSYRVSGSVPPPRFDPEPGRERMRGWLAVGLLGLLTATIAAAFVLVAIKRVSVTDMKSLLDLIIPPEVALAGSAIGFYFGAPH
jgi:hypothetical protein